jgi:CRISPR-associated endoribonuclease Cas6
MRLNLKLIPKNTVSQNHFNTIFYTDMHGFVSSFFDNNNNNKGSFCFGNLFPIRNQKIEEGKEYSFIISSPLPNVIEKLFFSIPNSFNIGECQFSLKEKQVLFTKLKNVSIIESLSPINITLHKDNKIKALKFDNEKYKFYLKKSLINKYNKITVDNLDSNFDLFNNIDIKEHERYKSNVFRINFSNKEKNNHFKVIGSKLVFSFDKISDEQLKIFQVLYDAGFGERSSFGAGFMVERWKK